MTQSYPPFAVFPDLNCALRLPSGVEYRGKLRQHASTEVDGEHWYEGYRVRVATVERDYGHDR